MYNTKFNYESNERYLIFKSYEQSLTERMITEIDSSRIPLENNIEQNSILCMQLLLRR